MFGSVQIKINFKQETFLNILIIGLDQNSIIFIFPVRDQHVTIWSNMCQSTSLRDNMAPNARKTNQDRLNSEKFQNFHHKAKIFNSRENHKNHSQGEFPDISQIDP